MFAKQMHIHGVTIYVCQRNFISAAMTGRWHFLTMSMMLPSLISTEICYKTFTLFAAKLPPMLKRSTIFHKRLARYEYGKCKDSHQADKTIPF